MNEAKGGDAIAVAEVEREITSNAAVKDLAAVIAGHEQFRVVAVRTQKQHDEYNDRFLDVKDTIKVTDGIRKAIVAPYNKKVDVVNAFFRALTGKLKPKASELERACVKWRTDQERKERERLRKLREEEERKRRKYEKKVEEAAEKDEPPPPPPPAAAPIRPRTSNVQVGERGSTHTFTDYEITVHDMKSLAKAVGEGKLPERVLDYRLKELKDLVKAGIDLKEFGCEIKEVRRLKGRLG